MSARWLGGLQVRGLDRGQTPVADLYCVACRTKVGEWLRANPPLEHRAACTATT